ncbi:ATP-binding protein [Curvivirga sp.]|uniref:ATP-binding protein n=1 Tax=Curvivirga sp. TaxID=2856848 RepID=UPI003B5CDC04
MFISLNSIRAKLLAVVLPLIAISMIALFAVLEYASISVAHEDLKQRLLQNTQVQALALSSPLWNYDIRAIRPILLALEQDPDFLYVTVRDVTGEEISALRVAGKEGAKASFEETLPIIYSSNDHEEIIGSVSVGMHDDRVQYEVITRLQRNVLVLIILMAVIVAATVVATERTIGYPLRELMKSIKLVKDNDIRSSVEWDSKDELGEVVTSYNEMIIQQELAERAMRASEERARDSEALLRDAVNSMSDGFALFDKDDKLVLFNRKFSDITPKAQDAIREDVTFEDIIRTAAERGDFPTAEGRIDDFVEDQIQAHHHFDDSTIIRVSDGRWILCTEHGTSSGGTVAVRTDISELKERELELQLAKEEADAANQAKSRFLANMSHELRTPLNAIIGFSDIVRSEMLGPVGQDRYKEYANDIYNSGSHLLDLINDVLDVSKVEAGAFIVNDEEFDVSEVVKDCHKLLEQRAAEKDLLLNVDVPEELPKLRADMRAVKQVILNLMNNAVKFTPAAGMVTVSAGLAQDGGMLIRVADNGEGMSMTDVETVMKPFGRLDSPWTQSEEGTGLGLPLSDMLVKAHDGKLTLESEVSKGTVVSIHLPKERVNTI